MRQSHHTKLQKSDPGWRDTEMFSHFKSSQLSARQIFVLGDLDDLTVQKHALLEDLPETGSVSPEDRCYSVFCLELVCSPKGLGRVQLQKTWPFTHRERFM